MWELIPASSPSLGAQLEPSALPELVSVPPLPPPFMEHQHWALLWLIVIKFNLEALQVGDYQVHFTDEETEAQKRDDLPILT